MLEIEVLIRRLMIFCSISAGLGAASGLLVLLMGLLDKEDALKVLLVWMSWIPNAIFIIFWNLRVYAVTLVGSLLGLVISCIGLSQRQFREATLIWAILAVVAHIVMLVNAAVHTNGSVPRFVMALFTGPKPH